MKIVRVRAVPMSDPVPPQRQHRTDLGTKLKSEAARRGIGAGVELMVDAHGSLEVPVAITLATALERYDIAWFEEPVSPENHRGQAWIAERQGFFAKHGVAVKLSFTPNSAFRNLAVHTEGLRTVLALRNKFSEPPLTLTDPAKYVDLEVYRKAFPSKQARPTGGVSPAPGP